MFRAQPTRAFAFVIIALCVSAPAFGQKGTNQQGRARSKQNQPAEPAPLGIVPLPNQSQPPPDRERRPPRQPFPWWQLLPPPAPQSQTPSNQPPPAQRQPPPPILLPDLVPVQVEFDAEIADQAWVTVWNRGNADARATKMRIELLDTVAPKRPAERVHDAVSEAENDLARLSTGAAWINYADLAKLKTFSAVDPSGEDPAPRRAFREVADKLDPDRADPKYRSVLNRPAVAALRGELEHYLENDQNTSRGDGEQPATPGDLLRYLRAFETGGGWAGYLQLSDLQRVLDTPPARRTDSDRELLQKIADKYAAAREDPRYSEFLSHPVFDAFQQWLAAALAAVEPGEPPDPLPTAIEAYQGYLQTVQTGPSWERYFDLPHLLEAARTPAYDRPLTEVALLYAARSKMDGLHDDPKYKDFVAQESFVALREALQTELQSGDFIVHVRPPIEFQPFEVRDPASGEAIKPDAELTLPDDRKVKAAEFYEELNRTEQQLNAVGYSLRDDDDDVLLQEAVTTDRFQVQAQQLAADIPVASAPFVLPEAAEPPPAKPASPELIAKLDLRLQEFHKENDIPGPKVTMSYVDVPALAVNATTRLLVKSPDPDYGFRGRVRFTVDSHGWVQELSEANNIREVDVATAPKVVRRPKEVHYVNGWGRELGSNKYFSAWLNSHVELHGTIQYTRGEASGEGGARIFSHDIRLLSASASAFGPKEGTAEVAADVSVLGVSYLDLHDAGATVNVSSSASKGVDVGYSVRFLIGPIPVKVKLGARGDAGLRYGLMAAPVQAGVNFQPFVHTTAYAQGGIDAIIAGGGIAANLTLVNYDGEARGSLALELASTQPSYALNYSYCHSISSLDGNVSAYAFIHVPRFGLPPWKKKTYRTKLFDWDGFHTGGCVFEGSEQIALYE